MEGNQFVPLDGPLVTVTREMRQQFQLWKEQVTNLMFLYEGTVRQEGTYNNNRRFLESLNRRVVEFVVMIDNTIQEQTTQLYLDLIRVRYYELFSDFSDLADEDSGTEHD
ncbi:unnamed protein product [Caenorhabditis bovis]|uniref:Uncharacterized protein n=1 Tax=Caenorhabditis bovis TaxID=2654633 RepID=A0A8S1EH88_9PELO|nr:unnamed protein product [Caenorhabditis bovis]